MEMHVAEHFSADLNLTTNGVFYMRVPNRDPAARRKSCLKRPGFGQLRRRSEGHPFETISLYVI
jgi:hypothetical protein